jgi:hypothetical protein
VYAGLFNRCQAAFVWLDERSILAVHFMIKATCVAQVVAVRVTTPQRRVFRMTIDAFPAICKPRIFNLNINSFFCGILNIT